MSFLLTGQVGIQTSYKELLLCRTLSSDAWGKEVIKRVLRGEIPER